MNNLPQGPVFLRLTFSYVARPDPRLWSLSHKPHEGARGHEGGQAEIIRLALTHKFTTAVLGRSSGKSGLAVFLMLTEAQLPRFRGVIYEFALATPYQDGARDAYRAWKQALAPLLSDHMGLPDGHSDVGMILHLRLGETAGVVLDFWGLENYDALRRYRKHRIVVDEAKDVHPMALPVLTPMLLGRDGKILFMGTPSRLGKGARWFRQMYDLGVRREPNHASFKAPTHCNPYVSDEEIAAEIATKRRTGGDDHVREEIYAEFLADEGAWFPNLSRVFTVPVLEEHALSFTAGTGALWIGERPDQGDEARLPDQYVGGVDVALKKDSTVVKIFNARTRREAALCRMRAVPQDEQRAQVAALQKMYGAVLIYDGTGGHGHAVAGDLALHDKQSFIPRDWNRPNKIHDLTVGKALCERAGGDEQVSGPGWYMLDVEWQVNEFREYQITTETSTGEQLLTPKFSAPHGINDDAVCAACLVADRLVLPYRPRYKAEGPPKIYTVEWFAQQQRSQNGHLRGPTANVLGPSVRR